MSDPTNPTDPGEPGGTAPPPPPPPPSSYPPPPPPAAGYGAPAGAAGYGVAPVGGPNLAEWWQRAVAVIIDVILLAIVMAVLAAVLDLDDGIYNPGRLLVNLVVGTAYFGLLNGGDSGQTLGKMALKIAVRDVNTGGKLGEGRGALRYIVSYVLGITCVLGIVNVLFPLWDPKRQAIHDKAATSVVVKV